MYLWYETYQTPIKSVNRRSSPNDRPPSSAIIPWIECAHGWSARPGICRRPILCDSHSGAATAEDHRCEGNPDESASDVNGQDFKHGKAGNRQGGNQRARTLRRGLRLILLSAGGSRLNLRKKSSAVCYWQRSGHD